MVSMLILQCPYLPSAVTESPAGQMFKPSVTFPYLSGHRIIITAHLESSCVSIHASNPLALLCMWSEHQKRRPASSCARRSVVVVQARHLMRCSAESIKRAVASMAGWHHVPAVNRRSSQLHFSDLLMPLQSQITVATCLPRYWHFDHSTRNNHIVTRKAKRLRSAMSRN